MFGYRLFVPGILIPFLTLLLGGLVKLLLLVIKSEFGSFVKLRLRWNGIRDELLAEEGGLMNEGPVIIGWGGGMRDGDCAGSCDGNE